ncbi:MAG: sigma-70 family RNA polymerase sigma factor [Candidatus Omnitrophota bacterium]|nr:sigma-70 family RNA polymerase sigma factor [Candidatus Omnitrophota bacterium]
MTDLDFVQKCANGDSQSWDEFLKRYSRLIYKYIRSVLSSKSSLSFIQDHADDLFQELFTSLIQDDYRKLRSFKGKNSCSLASWLRQVAVNFTLDYLRKSRPMLSLDAENEEGSTLKDVLTDGSFSIPELLNQEEMLKSLEECVGELNNKSKLVIELNINQGLRLEFLKDLFRVSRPAIDMQKSRIMDKLRECFRSKGFKLDFQGEYVY